MTIPDLREPGEVIDCMARIGDGEPVRAFLQLPSQAGPGLLRMVAPGGVGLGDDAVEEVRLGLLEGIDATPACLPTVTSNRCARELPNLPRFRPNSPSTRRSWAPRTPIRPIPPSRSPPIEVSVSWIEIRPSTADMVTNYAVGVERASVPFGEHQLQLLEIGTVDNSGDEAGPCGGGWRSF